MVASSVRWLSAAQLQPVANWESRKLARLRPQQVFMKYNDIGIGLKKKKYPE
jgi:hypothetical protein